MVDFVLSAGTGNWGSGGTWVGGVVPSSSKYGQIEAGHVVTVAADPGSLGIKLNGGSLVLNADFTFPDSPNAGIIISDTNSGGFSSNGAANAWRQLKSASVNPTYPWTIDVDQVDGTDKRVLDFRFVEMLGHKSYLGNSHNYAYFNDPTNKDYITFKLINPPMPSSQLIEHPVRGRKAARVYQNTISAAGLKLTGSCRYVSGFPITLANIIKSKQRIAFFSHLWHLPKCWIDGEPSMASRASGQYIDFTIMLREDLED